MMATGILPIPGKEKVFLKNQFGFEIDLTWFPIVSTCLSVIGVFIGALWIVEPIEKETNIIIGKLTFIPLFVYRMFIWLIILTVLQSFSIIAFISFVAINWLTLLFAQENLDIEPFSHSLLSVIFPFSKLPSYQTSSDILMKNLFWMVFVGNSGLVVFHIIIYCLYYFNLYNPWKSKCNPLLLQEVVFQNINPLVVLIFISATLPSIITHCLQVKRYLLFLMILIDYNVLKI